jgi:hypothetical protein
MTIRLMRSCAAITTGIALAVAASSGVAVAKPDKPEHAAQTADGTGCLVRDGAGAYHFDAACEWHTVVKRDKNNAIQFFSYQDKGNLPAGAPKPTSAANNSVPWPGCPDGIKETTTPSGQYSSSCRYGQGN